MNEPQNVTDEMAQQRAIPVPPMSIADAIERSRYLRKMPETILDDKASKRLIEVLLSAIEASPCYLKAVYNNIPSFTLLAYDRAAHAALGEWISKAATHGCREEKCADALRQLQEWDQRSDLRWPN